MAESRLAKFAAPAVISLVAFLSYSSQYLFLGITPGPLTRKESIIFNTLVACIWISYSRACTTDPGRVPKDWQPEEIKDPSPSSAADEAIARQRYCRKCEAVKPPRSHHCRVCKRCIPKMDHHCPWTVNCVSHFTFPHFMRFLWYAVSAMCYLEYFLFVRGRIIWDDRHMPSVSICPGIFIKRLDCTANEPAREQYLGPTLPQMIHLFFLIVLNSLTLFMVSITFLRTIWGLGGNVTTIESWEIERHAKLLRRARALGGFLDGPDGIMIRITRQEFPYDIGIWSNIVQGMGTSNVIAWFWPFSPTPKTSGIVFETNGFEDPGTSWPPPDPDRMPRLARPLDPEDAFVHQHAGLSPDDELVAFKERQRADFERRAEHYGGPVKRRKPFHERFEEENGTPIENDYYSDNGDDDGDGSVSSGEEGWQDSGGNRLKDYGVDEEVEFYDEDNIPIAELLRRRRGQGK
ncbi:hypothetical protein PV08_00254 [Exophiala spinifera]|uniref:Palmitoyltransferase PFA4 n=1 Tax=Exophiala spinifera TaxID=91928 RepID=A0A0D2BM55_9EURO|nr:uncharacterized protein PV08_00254 [Exophiala spinifera]KIW19680.1 hypothetical protein PV08_00254 [Exophiala spinifera]